MCLCEMRVYYCVRGPRRIEVARGRARPPGLQTGYRHVSPERTGEVCVRLFSAEFSVNRWVRRAEHVWVGARGCVRFDGKKGREARAGAARTGAALLLPARRSPLSLSGPNRRSSADGRNLFMAVTPLTLLRCPPLLHPSLPSLRSLPSLPSSLALPLAPPSTRSHSRPRTPLVYPLRVYCVAPCYIACHPTPRLHTTRRGVICHAR